MNAMLAVVSFVLDGCRYALHLSAIVRVARAVEMTPLPKAPEIVLGIVNVQGRIIPVVDVRGRFGLPRREMTAADQLIVARTSRRSVAFTVDAVGDIMEYSEDELIPASAIAADIEFVAGVVKLRDGMILIHDLEKFLSAREEQALDRALRRD